MPRNMFQVIPLHRAGSACEQSAGVQVPLSRKNEGKEEQKQMWTCIYKHPRKSRVRAVFLTHALP